MGATAAAAIMVRKQRELVELFTREGATSAVAAKTLGELNIHHESRAMRQLEGHAVIRQSAGRYYVDLESWQALRRTRHRMAFVMIALVLLLAIALGIGVLRP